MNDESLQSRKRTRRRPEQIKELLIEQARRGSSVEEFAAEQGIALSTVWAWRRRYRTGASSRQPRWVEVRNGSGAIGSAVMAQVRLPDGLSIELNTGFDVGAMVAFITRLRQG